MSLIEKIALGTPYLFLKKIPYAWIAAVALWTWPPIVSGVFLGIIALGLVMMVLQQRSWEAKILRECHTHGQAYRVRPRMPLILQVRNAAIVLAGSAILAVLLRGQLSLSGPQWFFLVAGFAFLYRDYVIFGASAVYLVTSEGIGVRWVPGHVDYRLFFHYNEMDTIARVQNPADLPAHYDTLSPMRGKKEGVLLRAKHSEGFSRELGHILLTPPDPQEFLAHVPATLIQPPSLMR